MATFEYVTNQPGAQTAPETAVKSFEAPDASTALKTIPSDALPTSGVSLAASPTPTAGISASSTAARDQTKALGAEIDSGISTMDQQFDDSGMRDASKKASDEIARQRGELAGMFAADESMINQLFAQTQAGLEEKQKKEFAGRSTGLITAGGYLGGTQSHEGVLANLSQQHRGEIAKLALDKYNALQSAKRAYQERDFQLADKLVQESKNLEDNIIKARADFTKNLREEYKFNKEVADDTIKTIISSGLTPNNDDIVKLASMKGVAPEIMQRAIINLQEIQTAESTKDKLASTKALADIMKAFPAGTSIPLPDGTTITAIGQSSDVSISHVTDQNGIVRQILTNKYTGEQTISSLGKIGKPSASGGGGGAGGFKFTNAQTGSLILQGLTQPDIQSLQADLNTYGATTVIQNIQNNPTMDSTEKQASIDAVTKLLNAPLDSSGSEFQLVTPGGSGVTTTIEEEDE